MGKHTQRDAELETLRRQLREGEKQVKRAEKKSQIEFEKSRIRKQLLLLKHPRKIALARRLGKGLKITGKKVGKAFLKQGRLIAAQQERDRRLQNAREKILTKPIKIRKSKKKRVSSNNLGVGRFDLTRLDF